MAVDYSRCQMTIKNYFLLLFFIQNAVSIVRCASQVVFSLQEVENTFLYHEIRIDCSLNATVIGRVSCRACLFKIGVIHSLFVYPLWREQGFGKQLLKSGCKHLEKEGADYIFIQPGPFDSKDGDIYPVPPGPDREIKLKKLRKLYSLLGFKKVPRFVSVLANAVYHCIGLQEDAADLMVRVFHGEVKRDFYG